LHILCIDSPSLRPWSRGYSKKRVICLSRPKENKQVWLTSFGYVLLLVDVILIVCKAIFITNRSTKLCAEAKLMFFQSIYLLSRNLNCGQQRENLFGDLFVGKFYQKCLEDKMYSIQHTSSRLLQCWKSCFCYSTLKLFLLLQ